MPYTPKPAPIVTNPTQGLSVDELIAKLQAQRPSSGGVVAGTDFYRTFPATLSASEKQALQQTMLDLGLYGNSKKSPVAGLWNPDLDGAAFKKVVEIAEGNGFYVGNSKVPDYRRVLAFGAADPKAFRGMFISPSAAVDTGPVTTKSTNVTKRKYDAAVLKDTVNAAYRQAVGREATADELAQAVNSVQKAYEKTPDKTTTATTRDGKGNTKSVSTVSGGVDEKTLISDQAKAKPEYGSFQSATTYFDAMLKALDGPVGQGA